MAGRFKNWWDDLWGDDDDSAFDDDLWDTLGIDQDDDPDTWWDDLTTTITPVEESNWIDDWSNFDFDEEYGIGSLINEDPNIFDDDWATTYDFGGWGDDTPTVDFEDPDFNWGEFDVDSYLDDLLDPNWGGGTEGDPSSWFIDSGDPAYQDYSGVGGGMPSPYAEFDRLLAELGYDPSTGSIEDWLQSTLPVTEVDEWADLRDASGNIDTSLATGPRSRGIFGGEIGPWLRDAFLGTGGLGGKKEGEDIGGIFGLLSSLFGGANTAADTVGGGLGGLLNSTLGQLAMLNYMKNKKESDIHVPIGYGGGGGGGGDGSPIDYRVFNLQPALMPGVAYANVGKPEGMKGGGLGDVTLARLEPGEFVVTKKAVDNVGAQNLYKMMKQWEGGG
jgi:hypothetical protein